LRNGGIANAKKEGKNVEKKFLLVGAVGSFFIHILILLPVPFEQRSLGPLFPLTFFSVTFAVGESFSWLWKKWRERKVKQLG